MGAFRQLIGLEESAASIAERRANQAEGLLEVLTESFVDAELAMEDRGWLLLSASAEREFTREGLAKAATLCRIVAVQDALVKRGLGVRQAYVFGQGVQIQATATGEDGDQDVNGVVQAFLDEPGNKAALTGDQAQEELERALGTDGNVFIACFTSPLTGFVRVRSIPFDEITDIIHNPDDRDDPWFYRRQWTQTVVTPQGTTQAQLMTRFYPALSYRPSVRFKTLDGHEVAWDAPIHHTSVNRLDGWAFGVGDAYAALPWARAYRDFLIDWSIVVKSLSQITFRASTKNSSKAQKMRQALNRRPTQSDPASGNPNSVGGTFVGTDGDSIEAIPKTGATINSESGRPLAAMIAAALDVPVTTLMADPGQTGARAVAETLNFPTQLAMQQRQSLWRETYKAILGYAIHQAAKAPRGPLLGTLGRDEFTGRETLALANDTDATIEVKFPPLDQVPVDTIIKAIVEADSTGKMPPLTTVKLMLHALGVDDIDEIVDTLTDENDNYIGADALVGQSVARAATEAFRRGDDPASIVSGRD